MIIAMHKAYTFEITIHEGHDEFWEEATKDGKSGCDEVLEELKSILAERGWSGLECDIRLIRFEEVA